MLKRLFDVVFSLLGIILLFPLFILVSVFIKLDTPGPVFFKQMRIGKAGNPFYIYKFRTMIANADKLGPSVTSKNDLRITKTGRILRKYKIDELPQLFNVLKGDMSLVGPRPEVPKYVEKYNEYQKKVLSLKPGITDPASLKFRNEEEILASYDIKEEEDLENIYINEIMPIKIELNLKYAENANIITDFLIIIRTLWEVVFR